jgi:hypothetical protein
LEFKPAQSHSIHMDWDQTEQALNRTGHVTWLQGLLPLEPTDSHTVEFVIQILKKAAKLASEAEARHRETWAGHLYKYLCKPQEITISQL